jgi:hypothetical protein
VPERLAALDAKVLLGIQAVVPDCVQAHDLLRRARFLFRATPTVLQELERLQQTAPDFTRALAENALFALPSWEVVEAPFTDTETQVTEIHVNRVIERGILDEKHRGDLFALLEAAYMDCLLFVTTRDELLRRRVDLTLALVDICGMSNLYIFAPSEITHFFKIVRG